MNATDIREAKELLELPERATLKQIKSNYRALLRRWHPDTGGDKEACEEMTRRIVAAQKIILAWCEEYPYSFSEEELSRLRSDEEWWQQRFGKNSPWHDS